MNTKWTRKWITKMGGVVLAELLFVFALLCVVGILLAIDNHFYEPGSSVDPQADYPGLGIFLLRSRYSIIVYLGLSLMLLLADVIFLCCVAGRKPDTQQVHLNYFDKIPLDLVLAAQIAVIIMCACMADGFYCYYFGSYVNLWELLVLCVLANIVFLTGLAGLLTFAARVKAGAWWKNTVVFRLLGICRRGGVLAWHGLARCIHALPMVWRTALFCVVYFILQLVCAMQCYWNDVALFVLVLIDFVAFAALLFAVFQMRMLKKAGEQLAAGTLEGAIDTDRMFWEFKRHGQCLNRVADGMAVAVEQRMRSERLKTELIANVSHDIRTPLTNLINYVDLLQKNPTPEQTKTYLEVLSRQSQRLKKLTEDLVEASKASTGNLSVVLVPTSMQETVHQAMGEYAERLAAGNLEAVLTLTQTKLTVLADGKLLWRTLDNLLNNVCKYALHGTRVYVDLHAEAQQAVLSIKNISKAALNIPPEELMERFVRGDGARSTEGSGLGLNIAKSLVELQKGTFSLVIDGDLFKVEVRLPLA